MKILIIFALIFTSTARAQWQIGGRNFTPISSGGTVTFTYVQGINKYNNATGTTSISITLGAAPTAGNNVSCYYWTYNNAVTTAPTVTVADGAANSYTVESPTNSADYTDVNGFWGAAYLLSAPSGASATITATFSSDSGGYSGLGCIETHRSTGTWVLDSYTPQTVMLSGSDGTITAPTCTVSGSNDFLYSGAFTENSMVTGTTVNAPWTGITAPASDTNSQTAYDLSATTNTTLNITAGAGFAINYTAFCLAFK